MKAIILIILISFYLKIISNDNILFKYGETINSSLGVVIFDSTNIKERYELQFKIKAKNFIYNYIEYYYFDEIHQTNNTNIINIDSIDKHYSNFLNLINKEVDSYKVNYFNINKNISNSKNIKGNYILILYYTSNNISEITSIKDEEEKEKNESFLEKNYIYFIIACSVFIILLIIFLIIYCCYRCKTNTNTNTNYIVSKEKISINQEENTNREYVIDQDIKEQEIGEENDKENEKENEEENEKEKELEKLETIINKKKMKMLV